MKKLIYQKNAREKLLEGARIMYDAVASTLGPAGRNVAITRQWGIPISVGDGVTVARDVMDKDEFVEMGIKLIREAASKTNEQAGDGTTSSIVLSYHLIDKGMKLLDQGVKPKILRDEMYEALGKINARLKEISIEQSTNDQIKKVAFISSASEEIASLVAEAMDKVGKDGLISVEDSMTGETKYEHTEGYPIDKGLAHPYFVTNPDRLEAVILNPLVAVLGKKITTINELAPLLEAMHKQSKDLVFIGDIGGDALTAILNNKMKGNVNAIVVDVPGVGQTRDDLLEDIAVITGGRVIKDEIGKDMAEFIQTFNLSSLGHAESFTANRSMATIIKGKGTQTQDRINQLRNQLKQEPSIYEQEKLNERIAKLSSSVAVIKVGGITEIDQRERLERVKDAVGAARAAMSEGIVPGGGIAFMRIAEALVTLKTEGSVLLYDVLQEPINKLLLNADKTEEEINEILKKIQAKSENFGYDLNSDSIVDMVDKGVIDPAKVIRLALENAVAVSSSILLTNVLIADKNERVPNGTIV